MRLDHPPGFTGPATPTERKRSEDSPVLPVSSTTRQPPFALYPRLTRLRLSPRSGLRALPRYRRVPPPRPCGPASSSSPSHRELVVHRRRSPAAARIGRYPNGIREHRRRQFQLLRNFATAFRASRDAVHAPTTTTTNTTTTTTSTSTLALVTNSESERSNERRRSSHESVAEREPEHRPLTSRHGDRPNDQPPARNQHQDQNWSSVQARHLDQHREQEDSRGARGNRTSGSSRDWSCSVEVDDNKTTSNQSADSVKAPSAPATSVPSVDVLAYTAYNDDANDNGIERDPPIRVQRREAHPIPLECPPRDPGRRQPVALYESPTRERNLGRKRARDERSVERGDESSFVARTDSIDRGVFGEGGDRDFRPRSDEDKTKNKKKKRKQSAEEHGRRGQIERRTDNTARSRQPITEASRGREGERGLSGSVGKTEDRRSRGIKGPTRKLRPRGRKHGLLFILYLLVWPLLCSTNPSGQFAMAFAQKPSLNHESLAQRNGTLAQYSSFLSSTVAHQQQSQDRPGEVEPGGHHLYRRDEQHLQHQQQDQPKQQEPSNQYSKKSQEEEDKVEQQRESQQKREGSGEGAIGSESAHPYNEYTWEVNQINPWLSACDLAGPAPADLQGSCGPPEVPKNCPGVCAFKKGEKGGKREEKDEFTAVIESLQASGHGEFRAWLSGKLARATQGSPVNPEGSPTDGTNAPAKKTKKKRQGEENEARNRMQGDRGNLDAGVRTAPEQCLFYLEESHKRDVCNASFGMSSTRSFLSLRKNRYWFMSGLRLRHCCEHAVVNALAPGKGGPLEDVLNGGPKCTDALDKLLLVDALAARLHCEFEEVLARYDCAQPYSVIHNCTHCKEAYRKWVCSSLVPYFAHGGPGDLESLKGSWTGSRLRPCRFFCQSVEQRCPYLLPGDRAPAYPTQYAGEPTFLCRDPNIPETGEQAARALHSSGEDECCFHVCSEEAPGSGICANCTEREPRKRGRSRDPPTAPHCESNPIQSLPTGQQYPFLQGTETSTEGLGDDEESSVSAMPSSSIVHPQQGASLCGSGRLSSMTIASSSNRTSSSSLFLWLSSIFLLFIGRLRCSPSALLRGQPAPEREPPSSTARVRRSRRQEPPERANRSVEASGLWPLLKWVMIECRCRGWWWWWWWWWRSPTAGPVGPRSGSFMRLLSRKCGDWGQSRWCWWLWYRWRTRRKCAQQRPLGPRHPHGRWKRKRLKASSKVCTGGEGEPRRSEGFVKEARRSSTRLRREYLRLSSKQEPP